MCFVLAVRWSNSSIVSNHHLIKRNSTQFHTYIPKTSYAISLAYWGGGRKCETHEVPVPSKYLWNSIMDKGRFSDSLFVFKNKSPPRFLLSPYYESRMNFDNLVELSYPNPTLPPRPHLPFSKKIFFGLVYTIVPFGAIYMGGGGCVMIKIWKKKREWESECGVTSNWQSRSLVITSINGNLV